MNGARFERLWRRAGCGCARRQVRALYRELRSLYSLPGRVYHTAAHVDYCLGRFDECRDLVADPEAVEMALWFHDAVYDTRAADNELKSADLFAARAAACCAPGFVAKVHALVLATVHPATPTDHDAQFVTDIDLSGFALPWAEFRRDSQAVRAEYPFLSDASFYARHLAFLRSLSARERFYCTDYFHARYERAARHNIDATLAALHTAGYREAGAS